MAPEYKVRVPDYKAESFEKMVVEMNLVFEKRGFTKHDGEIVINKQLSEVRKRVNQILVIKEPSVDAAIDLNINDLLINALTVSKIRVTDPLPVNLVDNPRDKLCEIFLECTKIKPKKIRRIGIAEWPQGTVRPMEILILIDKYGLEDGKPKSIDEIADNYKFAPSYISNIARRGLFHLGSKLSRTKRFQ